MPYFDNLDTYINPYYLDVTPAVRAEMYQRAQYYGARTRTGINSSVGNGLSNTIEWPYQKMPWAYVTSKTFDNIPIVLGFDMTEKDGAKVMSDETGNLTLYESVRNVPKLPLLTSIEISNEGLRGSLLKGKFTFTFFPSMLPDGFELEALQRIFFTPGNKVNIGFGWSVSAFNQRVNKLEFTGIIYGFNWSFNQNTSISAEVQVVSPSTLAIGLSGEQTVFPTDDANTEVITDPTGRPLPPETNIITIIQKDLRSQMGSDGKGVNVSETGKVEFLSKSSTTTGKFNYFKIGLPTVVGSSFEDASAGRILLTEQEVAQEQQQQFQEAVESQVQAQLTASAEITEGSPSENAGVSTISSKPEAGDGGLRPTDWNVEYKQTASTQLKRFLNSFIQNKGDNTPQKREWLDKWKDSYKNKETGELLTMGRYVFLKHEKLKNDWNQAYWGTSATLENSQIPGFSKKSFDDFVVQNIYAKENDTYDKKVNIIKRKIAELGANELEELKCFAYYRPKGQYNGTDENKNAYLKFFYIAPKDQGDIKAGTLQRDKYFWPDNLKFVVYDTTGKETTLTMSDMWNNFNSLQSVKDLRAEYDGKHTDNENNQKYLNAVKERTKDFESILNKYIQNSLYFAKGMVAESPEDDGKPDGEAENKKPKEKVTPEEKQRLDGEISELKSFQSVVSRADVFKTDNNETFKKFEQDYPLTKFVGGVDVKSIKDNISYDLKGAKNEEIPIRKSAQTSKFVQKLIDAREEQKKTGIDTVKDLIKVKSNAYQERLNNANAQNGESPEGGGGDGSGTDISADGTTDATAAQQYQSQVIGQTYWYITLKDLVEFANQMMDQFEGDQKNSPEGKKYTFQKFRIQCNNNETEYQPDIKSAFPQNVYFPDISMGGYQTFNPFYDNEWSDYLRTFEISSNAKFEEDASNIKSGTDGQRIRVEDDVINVGNILIGINLIISVYRQFLINNATNISYKNLTSFFDEIIKGVNAASGDTYQLVSHLFTEPETLTELIPKADQIGESNRGKMSVLSIEDTHIARKHSQTVKANEQLYAPNFIDDSRILEENMGNQDIYSVKPFVFEASIFKPLIKNVTITSKPPKELAFSAYIAARGQEANAKGGDFRKAQPYSGDAMLSRPVERDEDEYQKQGKINTDQKTNEEKSVATQGFTQEWCDNYRSILTKAKRLTTKGSYVSGRSIPIGGHWLNKAIYPVEFSVTIDGINGFKFGDVIKTTLIPRHYNVDWDMVFTVTKILHKVTPSTWETTLNTAARLSLDSPLTGISATTSARVPIDPNLPPLRRDLGFQGPNPQELQNQPR
jgi:hypothetical protein